MGHEVKLLRGQRELCTFSAAQQLRKRESPVYQATESLDCGELLRQHAFALIVRYAMRLPEKLSLFFIFGHKNMNRNGLQKIYIRPLQIFQKIEFENFIYIKNSPIMFNLREG